MKALTCLLFAWACLAVFAYFAQMAFGYAGRGSLSLEQMSEETDVIFKGVVLSTEPAKNRDAWFQNVAGFGVQETQFQIVSTIKGAWKPD